MFRFFTALLLTCLIAINTSFAAEPNGDLTQTQINSLLKSVPLDGPTKAAMNAVTNNDIKDLAINRDITAVTDDIFSFKLPAKGITDQESSGRCWMFAGLNLMRQSVAEKYDLDDFELSQSYLAFWDMLEKSNEFLEYIIDTRKRDIRDRELDKRMESPVSDGGYWNYVTHIVQKYGVVPKMYMNETKSSANTGRMQNVLNELLRRDAARLRGMANKSDKDLRQEKMQMLQDVMRVLVINYGRPPLQFEWRTTDSTGKVSEPVVYTPQQFYSEVIGLDLSQYVSLACYPIHPFGKNYSINATRYMPGLPDVTFINVDAAQMKSYALKALLDSNRVWFGCDVSYESHGKKGLLIKGLYDYEDLFGIKLDMTKTERLDYRGQSSNHAMVLSGVDMVNGNPRKWLVENSWGKDRGDGGFFTMSDEWFDDYVMNVIVPRKYLPDDVAAIADQKPTPLPIWDPVWKSLRAE
ncbi:MAG: aminopeptidase C [Calditrichota bacterium]